MNIKWISIGVVGSLFAVSHIGMIGHIATRKDEPKLPSLNIPVGPYTTYKAQVSEEGYAVTYRANDPKTMYITKDIKKKAGFLGLSNNTEKIVEEYVMDGQTNQGGPVSKQLDQQRAQADSLVPRLVLVLPLLLVVSPLLVGSLLVGWQCLVVIRDLI